MKPIVLFQLAILLSVISFGQTVVDISKTQKITQQGTELIIFQGKPFTGFVTEIYPNGKPKVWISIKNGLANGQWQEWLENGKLRYNAYWKDGKGHGLWQYFHDNGLLKYEEAYIMDIPIGISRAYYDNGQIKDDFFWLQGKKQGIWTYYNKDGTLLKTEIYDDNKIVSTTEK